MNVRGVELGLCLGWWFAWLDALAWRKAKARIWTRSAVKM